MSVLNPKTRLVSFRLSQEEYSELCALCSAQRARSISDFVRDNMHWILGRVEVEHYPGAARDPMRRLLEPQPVPAARQEVPYMARPASQREFSALADMLVDLHRRTEALDRQVHRLSMLLRSSDPACQPEALLDEEEETQAGPGLKSGHGL